MNNANIMFDSNNVVTCLTLDEFEKMNNIGNFASKIQIAILSQAGLCLFILNIILGYISKEMNKKLIFFSILSIVIYFIGLSLYTFAQPIGGVNINNVISIILRITSSIIQIIIFARLVLNIIKRRRNLKCQE